MREKCAALVSPQWESLCLRPSCPASRRPPHLDACAVPSAGKKVAQMAPPIVEGVRVDGPAAGVAPRVVGIVETSTANAAIAVPIGPWADLGVSAGSSVDDIPSRPLLPITRPRSHESNTRDMHHMFEA